MSFHPSLFKPFPEEINAVYAGKDNPVKDLQLIECLIETVPSKRGDDFNGGKEDDLGPQSAEMFCKSGRLLAGPGNEDLSPS
jgi:hypothetical protein